MSKYGDDYACTCEMFLVSARNHLHAVTCELWQDKLFTDGVEEWDGDLSCLVMAASPWEHAEEWVWNGDTPVVRKTTAQDRTALQEAITEWEEGPMTTADVELISPEEQEVMDALTDGTAEADATGLIELPDGSYADFDMRVTYRKVMVEGTPIWTEIFWDGAPTEAEKAEASEPKVYTCTCTTKKIFFCIPCKVQRDKETDPWRYWAGHSATTTSSYSYSYARCAHCFDTFELPGQQHENIKISGRRTHTVDTMPDYGLYAYAGWSPSCLATFIPWQDYGLPTIDYVKVAQAITHAWDLACEGQVVEVGCMGGHGRTGTILACLALLSDPTMSARQAILHVRKVHCDEAIETNQQEWFVAWFRSHITGEKCPTMPKTYVSKHSANWQAAGKAATAVKANVPELPQGREVTTPLAQKYPADGSSTRPVTARWCDHCKRFVHLLHNNDCPFYGTENEPAVEVPAQPLTFDTAIQRGDTANARRRNAKRANRRNARRRAKHNTTILQEYV